MEQGIGTPGKALLVNPLYGDEYKDGAFRRLRHLQLWRSLTEEGSRWLGYPGDIRYDDVALAGKRTLRS